MQTSRMWFMTMATALLVLTGTSFGQTWQTAAEKEAHFLNDKHFESHAPNVHQVLTKGAGTTSLGPVVRYDYNVTTAMPDVSTTDIPITVSGFTGVLGKVTVSLHLIHTWDADLDIYLIAPDATIIELSTDNGINGDDYGTSCSPDANRTTFDDGAALSIVGQFAPFAGAYRPEAPLSGFDGKSGSAVNGTWTLRIIDDAFGDVGTFYCASLFLSPLTGFETVSSTLYDGNSSGFVDPNECSTLDISLQNVEGVTHTGITATLSTTTPGVVITQPVSAYPDAAALAVVTNTTPFGIGTKASYICGTPVVLNLALSYDGGSDNQTIILQGGVTMDVSNNVPVLLPDRSTTDIPLSVSGFAGTLSQLRISLHLTHTWDGDLDLILISPDNTVVLLSGQNGGSGDDYGTSCSTPTVFDDNATVSIVNGTPPFAGTYIPEVPLSTFYGKSGAQVNGTWILRIHDNLTLDQGEFKCATLSLGPICTDGGSLPPTITVSLDPEELWPPNHKMEEITASVQTSGGCGTVGFTLDAVVSNEDENGLGDGDTPDDIQNEELGTPDIYFDLRKERSGTGTGRVYTATYTATDMIDNSSTTTATVTAPLSQSSTAQHGGFAEDQQVLQNYPNPFNPLTRIAFQLDERSMVAITIMDVFGREVERLVSQVFDAGLYSRDWDASQLPSGTYFARLQVTSLIDAQSHIVVKKMILSK